MRAAMGGAVQTSSPAPLPEVTVTAPRPPTPEELSGNAVSDFIRTHAAPAVVSGQLARWGGGIGRGVGICPITVGLSPGFNDFVSARILAVAVSVGAPIQAAERCRHNVYIVFAADPQNTLKQMVKQDPRILGYHYAQQTRDLETVNRPIQGWYLTSTRGARGDETIDEPNPLLPPESGILNQGKHPSGLPGSRLSSSISSAIVNVVIVVDVNKIEGRPIGAIADYLAVLTLTQAFATERCGTLPSIMDMMLPNCHEKEARTGITAGDLAFLRALYKADLDAVLPLERDSVENSMKRQFKGH
jgi:hypothetical protein